MRLVLAACLALALCLEAGAQLTGNATSGQGTGQGSCGYPASGLYAPPAAISIDNSLALQTSPLAGCGVCIEVQALCSETTPDCRPGPPVIAQVTTLCTSCSATDVALSQDVFQQLGGTSQAGRLPISYRAVECNPPNNVSVSVLMYRATEGGYVRLVPFNVAGSGGIATVELRQTPLLDGRLDVVASQWRKMHNMWGATWELSGLPAPPLDLRLTDGAGRIVLARRAITQAGQVGVLPTAVQFPLANSTAGIAAASQAALTLPEVSSLSGPSSAPASPTTATPATAEASPAAVPLLPPSSSAEGAPAASAQDAGTVPAASSDAELPTEAAEGIPAEAVQDPSEEAAAAEEEELALPLVSSAAPAGGAACNSTILDLLTGQKAFSTFVALIRAAGLEGAFIDTTVPFTVLAPVNSAWRIAIKQFPLLKFAQPATLRNVILQHMIVGAKLSSDFQPQLARYDTLAGGFLSIKASFPTPAASPATEDSAALTAGAQPLTSPAAADSTGPPRLLVVSQASAGGSLAVDLPACSSVVDAMDTVLVPDLGASGGLRRRRQA